MERGDGAANPGRIGTDFSIPFAPFPGVRGHEFFAVAADRGGHVLGPEHGGVRFNRIEGVVRIEETDRQEERLAVGFACLEIVLNVVGYPTVLVKFQRDVAHVAFVVAARLELGHVVFEQAMFLQPLKILVLAVGIPFAFEQQVEAVCRVRGVAHPDVVEMNLADQAGLVAGRLQPGLDHIGIGIKRHTVLPAAVVAGILAGEPRGAGRHAHRVGRETAVKPHAGGCQAVEVGGLRHSAAITAKALEALLVGVEKKKVQRFRNHVDGSSASCSIVPSSMRFGPTK